METDVDIQDVEETQDETQDQIQDDDKESQWNQTRQERDFARANERKARAELETMTEALEQSNTKMAQLEEQLAGLQQQKQDEQDKLAEMDPDLVPEEVSRNILTLERQLKQKADQLSSIQEKVARYEQEQQKAEEKRRQDAVRNAVFDTVETALAEVGIQGAGQYRNEANKLADQLVDSGEEVQPETMAAAVKLMTKCYRQVRNAKTSKKSASVSTDTGKSGATPESPAKKTGEIKPGRLAEVKAQMLKNTSWKG